MKLSDLHRLTLSQVKKIIGKCGEVFTTEHKDDPDSVHIFQYPVQQTAVGAIFYHVTDDGDIEVLIGKKDAPSEWGTEQGYSVSAGHVNVLHPDLYRILRNAGATAEQYTALCESLYHEMELGNKVTEETFRASAESVGLDLGERRERSFKIPETFLSAEEYGKLLENPSIDNNEIYSLLIDCNVSQDDYRDLVGHFEEQVDFLTRDPDAFRLSAEQIGIKIPKYENDIVLPANQYLIPDLNLEKTARREAIEEIDGAEFLLKNNKPALTSESSVPFGASAERQGGYQKPLNHSFIAFEVNKEQRNAVLSANNSQDLGQPFWISLRDGIVKGSNSESTRTNTTSDPSIPVQIYEHELFVNLSEHFYKIVEHEIGKALNKRDIENKNAIIAVLASSINKPESTENHTLEGHLEAAISANATPSR